MRINGGRLLHDVLHPGMRATDTSTRPSGVRIASESSCNSKVPGLSETSAVRYMPGAISVFLSIS
jgi:hypothetical protein